MNVQLGETVDLHMGTQWLAGTVAEIKRNSDKSVRLIGVRPAGTDHVAWYAPRSGFTAFESVGGSSVAYLV